MRGHRCGVTVAPARHQLGAYHVAARVNGGNGLSGSCGVISCGGGSWRRNRSGGSAVMAA